MWSWLRLSLPVTLPCRVGMEKKSHMQGGRFPFHVTRCSLTHPQGTVRWTLILLATGFLNPSLGRDPNPWQKQEPEAWRLDLGGEGQEGLTSP